MKKATWKLDTGNLNQHLDTSLYSCFNETVPNV